MASTNGPMAMVANTVPALEYKEIPRPTPEPNQVVVKIDYAAQNPTDIQSFDSSAFGDDVVFGCDFVGKVTELGKEVSLLKEGDLVAGLIWGGEKKNLGAYAQYTVADEKIAFKVPSSVSPAAASTIPLALTTAWLAMFSRKCLNMSRDSKQSILVWGGSSSVGQFTIQIGALYNMNIVTVCSPRNFDLVKKLGATHVFDYNAPDVIDSIRKAAPSLKYIFDTIGNKDSSALAASAAGSDASLCTVRPGKANTENVPKSVNITDVLVWTAFLKDHAYGDFKWPADPADHELGAELFHELPGWLESGKIKPNDVLLLEGLKAIPEGFQLYRNNKISGQKVVYKL